MTTANGAAHQDASNFSSPSVSSSTTNGSHCGTLYFIGLGLGGPRDVTLSGLDAIQQCTHLYLDHYTAVLPGYTHANIDTHQESCAEMTQLLQQTYQTNVEITLATREIVEHGGEMMQHLQAGGTVGFLVVGDAFAATTHHDLLLRAAHLQPLPAKIRVCHNASIMNAIASTGLQLYRFGQTISIPFALPASVDCTDAPAASSSYVSKIAANQQQQLHTLCLLDIKVREQLPENIARGSQHYEPPRYMTVNQAVDQLLDVQQRALKPLILSQPSETANGDHQHASALQAYNEDTRAFGVARLGHEEQVIVSGTLRELRSVDFGPPLHSLVICSTMHEIEADMYDYYNVEPAERAAEKQRSVARQQQQLDAQYEEQRQQTLRRQEEQQRRRQQLKAEQAQKQQQKQKSQPAVAADADSESESDELSAQLSAGLF